MDDFYKNPQHFVSLIRNHNFDYGFSSPVDIVLEIYFKKDFEKTKNWLGTLFVNYYNEPMILISLIHAIGRLDFNDLSPIGSLMVLSVLNHPDIELRDAVVHVLESWGNEESLKILKMLHYKEQWLQDYVNCVITDINEDLASKK